MEPETRFTPFPLLLSSFASSTGLMYPALSRVFFSSRVPSRRLFAYVVFPIYPISAVRLQGSISLFFPSGGEGGDVRFGGGGGGGREGTGWSSGDYSEVQAYIYISAHVAVCLRYTMQYNAMCNAVRCDATRCGPIQLCLPP